MKIYISSDIEGITGVTHWDETNIEHTKHAEAAKQMTKEILAACEGAIEAGATEILIKDGHGSGRNIEITDLPKEAKIIRGWTNSPESMMALLDDSFDAVIFIGYHSGAYSNGNPLSHTMNQDNNWLKINGIMSAEFDMNSYVASYYNVPVVFLSGDKKLCERGKNMIPCMEVVAVKDGCGNATINISPSYACKLIKEGVKKGLYNKNNCKLNSPESFHMVINYKQAVHAYRASFYPNAKQLDEHTTEFTGNDIQEMMAARMFML